MDQTHDWRDDLRKKLDARVPPGPDHDRLVDAGVERILDFPVPSDAELMEMQRLGLLPSDEELEAEGTFWRPLSTLPKEGKFLLAVYAPTSWQYWVQTTPFYLDEPPRLRENKLRYACAWAPLPPEPPLALRDAVS